MRTAPSLLVVGALLASSLALAQPTRRPLRQAGDAFNDAVNRINRAQPHCRAPLGPQVQALAGRVNALPPNANFGDLNRAVQDASGLASTAAWHRCPDQVVDALERGVDRLEEARSLSWNDRRGGMDQFPAFAQLSPLQVSLNDRFDGEQAVRVSVPELTLRGMRGQGFYLGARFRSFQGNWSDWVTTQVWTAPQDPFVWRNAFNHYFRYSTLAEEDFADGRFVARVALFDARGQQLAFREVTFRVQRLPRLPVGPPVMQPMPVQPMPMQPMVQRDCGTGADVGCVMVRDGQYAMDAAVFQGLMNSLQATPNELQRLNTLASVFQRSYVTAVQLGLILDLFRNDLNRTRASQYAAPRTVNAQHALGYAAKWSNGLLGQQYTQLMAAQPQGFAPGQPMQPMHPAQPVHPVGPPPPPPPPPHPGMHQPHPGMHQQPVARDCGTGPNDPGCGIPRNGLWAMDAQAWAGAYQALRGAITDHTRQSMAQSILSNQAITAAQLGLLLDLFTFDAIKLDVAKFAAPRVTNPSHALGLSTKFMSTFHQQDFVQVMSQQR